MPLEVSQEIQTWLQRRGLGRYLCVIDAPPHPDTQEIDLKRGEEHDVEIPPHMILNDYFGLYSVFGKAYRTYGGPNKFLNIDGIYLCAYEPHMYATEEGRHHHQGAQMGTVDWGILNCEGV